MKELKKLVITPDVTTHQDVSEGINAAIETANDNFNKVEVIKSAGEVTSVAIKELQKKTAVLDVLRQDVNNITEDIDEIREDVSGKSNTSEVTSLAKRVDTVESALGGKISGVRVDKYSTGVQLSIKMRGEEWFGLPNIGIANTNTPGLMSAEDKAKLDGLSADVLDKYILTPLPKWYTPCKYLQSNGGYLNTGVMGDAPLKMQGVFTAPSAGEYSLLAARKGDTWLSLASVVAGKYQYGYGALAPIKDNGGGESNVIVDLRADAQAGEVAGTQVSGTDAQNVALNLPLYLFACNYNGTAAFIAPAETRLTSCKIYSAGFATQGEIFLDMKRDFVPCLNPEKVAGLYDLVEGKFYTSANDKAFTAVPIDKGDKKLMYNSYEQNLLDNVESKTNRFYSVANFNIPPHLRGRRISFSAKVIGDIVDGVDVVKKYGVCADAYTTKRESGFVWPNNLFNKVCIPDTDGYIHYDNLVTGETSTQIYLYTYHHLRIKTKDADNPLVTLSEPMLTATPTAKPFEPPVGKWFLPSWIHKYL